MLLAFRGEKGEKLKREEHRFETFRRVLNCSRRPWFDLGGGLEQLI